MGKALSEAVAKQAPVIVYGSDGPSVLMALHGAMEAGVTGEFLQFITPLSPLG